MKFVLNMAWREMRASWYRLLLFFLCIAIGVGSIVALRSFTQVMKISVAREVRTVSGADVRVALNQPWKPETKAVLERYSTSPLVTGHTQLFDTQTMVRSASDSNARPVLVQLMAVGEQFPLYGQLKLVGGARYTPALLNEQGVLASQGLLSQLNLKAGDTIKIGLSTFTIRGVIERLPGITEFVPVPRVAIAYAEVEALGLTVFGSRGRYGWLFKTIDGQDEALVKELAREFRTTRLDGLWSFRGEQNFMREMLGRLEGFLSMIGLAILVLGGIGIASVTRVFVQQKMKTIAILKVLGGRNRRVLGAYLMQVVALSLGGSLTGLLLAGVITVIGSRLLAGRLPFDFEPTLTWQASLQGVGIGVFVTLLFALPPLLEIRRVKPILVLRSQDFGRATPRVNKFSVTKLGWLREIDWARLGAGALVLPGLMAIAFWQSSSLRIAGIFLAALVTTAVALNLAGWTLMYSLRRVRHLPSFVLRQGVSSLYRPGNQTRVVLFTVGLGALFIITMRFHQVHVQRQYNLDLDSMSADLFMVDLQKDQRLDAEATLARLGCTEMKFIPIVQGRIIGFRRDPGNQNLWPNRLPQNELRGRLTWERRYSYRPNLEEHEKIIAGKFWDSTPSTEPEVSVDQRYAEDIQLGVGDKLFFDIVGQRIEAKVTSIRTTKQRYRPVSNLARFNIIFRPGALEEAPQTFIGGAKGPPPGAQRAELQRELVEQFLNVTVIDGFDAIAEIQKRFREAQFAVSFIGGFVFLCGALILTGSIAMTKFHRLYEAAILKTLGAKKRLIIYITLIEYGVLGLLAGVIGSAAAMGLTWTFYKYELNIPWEMLPSVNLAGVGVTLLLVVVVGVMASWDVMVKKPLGILRAE